MPYREQYITYDEFEQCHNPSDGNLYEGFVIGCGYVYPQSGFIFPSHWNGYGSGSADIPSDQTHSNGVWQYEKDDSIEAVIMSLKPLRDAIASFIVTRNEFKGTITLNVGMGKLITIPDNKDLYNIEFVKSDIVENSIALKISVKNGNTVEGLKTFDTQILLKDIETLFGVTFSKVEIPTPQEQEKFNTGYGPRWLSYVPFIGSARDAYEDFENGRYWWGAFNTVMAISDVFLVKSLIVAGGKFATKTALKTGSHTWGATRSWMGRTGQAAKGQHVHHWFLHRSQGIGKHAPDWLKNQPWNLMPMKSESIHMMIHSPKTSIVYKFYHGTPQWFKATGIYGIDAIENGTRE